MSRDRVWLSGWRPYALLAALCLALYLPGIAAIPPLDRDEARFAQASRQMLETGDFLHIRFQDEARNKKPAGIYWLQAASVAVLSTPESTAIWPYRLPSMVGALAALFWTATIAAVLFKGPVGPAIAALTIVTLSVADRDWRWLRGLYPLAGIIFVALPLCHGSLRCSAPPRARFSRARSARISG